MNVINKSISKTNYGGVNEGRKFIIIHANGGTASSTLNWFKNPDANVSYHYLVTLTGEIWQFVDENERAWHAGVSEWDGFTDLNDLSVGIAIESDEGLNSQVNGAQYTALLELTQDVQQRYGIHTAHIRGHKEVSPGRKTDPLHLDMDKFRDDVDDNEKDAISVVVLHGVPKNIEVDGTQLILRGKFVTTRRGNKLDVRYIKP